MKKTEHAMWLYKRGEEPRLFEKDEFIPDGWLDAPDSEETKAEKPKKPKPETEAE